MPASRERISGERIRLLGRFRQLDVATQRKLVKFVWSGLLIMAFGFVLIIVGLILDTGAYSAEGLLIGFGIIAVIVGLIRLLIGFINPLSPSDLAPVEQEESKPANDLDAQLFES